MLSRKDILRQRACLSKGTAKANKRVSKDLSSLIAGSSCLFIDGGTRNPVALASAGGSGNTWVRGLLEKGSGFCTGFNFCDYMMRMKGFIGENINSGSVLVVKTHMKMPQWLGSKVKIGNMYEATYGSGIFLLRNPLHSLVAEWNRKLTLEVMIKEGRPHNESHVNVAPKEIWCKN